MLEAIQDTVRLVGPALLTQEQLGQAFERFRAVLDDSAKRRKERSAITTGEDFDDEEAEALEVSCQDSSNSTIQTVLAGTSSLEHGKFGYLFLSRNAKSVYRTFHCLDIVSPSRCG